MNNNFPPEKTERLAALLGIGAQTHRHDPPPPSDEQLAAFMDGRLQGTEREAMLAYLNRHPEYRHRWLEIASQLAHLTPPEQEAEAAPAPQPRPWLTIARRWMLAATALPAAAAALLAGLLLWPVADLERRIDAVYAAAAPVTEQPELPWEGTGMSFGPLTPAPAARAFGAGLWDGRLALGTVDADRPGFLEPPSGQSWAGSAWSDYYLLGRWLLLLRAAAGVDTPILEIQEHQTILAELRRRLQQSDTPEVHQTLAALALLEPLLANPDNPALARRLELIIGQLAP